MAASTMFDLLLRYLQLEGVEYLFGIPGGSLTPLYAALRRQSGIRTILAKHEQGAAFMADGYARVTRHLGVCCATSGPGGTNALTPLACAYADSIPVLLLTAQVSTAALGKGAVQESSMYGVDLVEIFKPVTKLSASLAAAPKSAELIRRALRTALSGRFGPVHLSIPGDLARQPIARDFQAPDQYRASNGVVDRAALAEVAKLLENAAAPCILAGSGVYLSGAAQELRELAELLRIPVATTPKAKGILPEDHPLSLGIFGYGGHPRAERYLYEHADVLVVVGSSLGEFQTNTWDARLAPREAMVQIDIDPREIGENYPLAFGVVADAKAALHELAEILRAQPAPRTREQPLACVADVPRRMGAVEDELTDTVPLKPQRVVRALRELLPDDAIVFSDIGNTMSWLLHDFESRRPGTFFLNLGMGSMGHALPAAIGGKLAAPDRPVVAVAGDAGFAMTAMELHTAAEYGIPVVTVVFNNGGHGMVENGDKLVYGEAICPARFERRIDAAALGASLGAASFAVTTAAELEQALRAALQHRGPSVLDVQIDPAEIPPAIKARADTLRNYFAGKAQQ